MIRLGRAAHASEEGIKILGIGSERASVDCCCRVVVLMGGGLRLLRFGGRGGFVVEVEEMECCGCGEGEDDAEEQANEGC